MRARLEGPTAHGVDAEVWGGRVGSGIGIMSENLGCAPGSGYPHLSRVSFLYCTQLTSVRKCNNERRKQYKLHSRILLERR